MILGRNSLSIKAWHLWGVAQNMLHIYENLKEGVGENINNTGRVIVIFPKSDQFALLTCEIGLFTRLDRAIINFGGSG